MKKGNNLLIFSLFLISLLGLVVSEDPWKHVASVDCEGNVFLFANSPFAVSANLNNIQPVINAYFDLVHVAAQCGIPSLSKEDAMKTFVPFTLLDYLMEITENDPRLVEPFTDFWDAGFIPLFDRLGPNADINWPCTLTEYLTSSCQFGIDLLDSASAKFNVEVTKCPFAFNPKIDITLSGDAASFLLKPCSQDSDCQTTGNLVCFEANITDDNIMEGLNSVVNDSWSGCNFSESIFAPDQLQCNSGEPFARIKDWWMNFFSPGASASSHSGFCLPSIVMENGPDPALFFDLALGPPDRVSSTPGVPLNFWIDDPTNQGSSFGTGEYSVRFNPRPWDNYVEPLVLTVDAPGENDGIAFNFPINWSWVTFPEVQVNLLCKYPVGITEPQESDFLTFQQNISGTWVDAVRFSCYYEPLNNLCEGKTRLLMNGRQVYDWWNGIDCCPSESSCNEWGTELWEMFQFGPGGIYDPFSWNSSQWLDSWLDWRITRIDRLVYYPNRTDTVFFSPGGFYVWYPDNTPGVWLSDSAQPDQIIGSAVVGSGVLERRPAFILNNTGSVDDYGWKVPVDISSGFVSVSLEMSCDMSTEFSYVQFLDSGEQEIFQIGCGTKLNFSYDYWGCDNSTHPSCACASFEWFFDGTPADVPSWNWCNRFFPGSIWSEQRLDLTLDIENGHAYLEDDYGWLNYVTFDYTPSPIAYVKFGTPRNSTMALESFVIVKASRDRFWNDYDSKISAGPERRSVTLPFATWDEVVVSLPTPPSLENPFSDEIGPLAAIRRIVSFNAQTGTVHLSFNDMLNAALKIEHLQEFSNEIAQLLRELSDCLTGRLGYTDLTEEQFYMRMLPWFPEFWMNKSQEDLGAEFSDFSCVMTDNGNFSIDWPVTSCQGGRLHASTSCEFSSIFYPSLTSFGINAKIGFDEAFPAALPSLVIDARSGFVTWVNKMTECTNLGSTSDCDSAFGAGQAQFFCENTTMGSSNGPTENDHFADWLWDTPIQEIPGACRSNTRFLNDMKGLISQFLNTGHPEPDVDNPELYLCVPQDLNFSQMEPPVLEEQMFWTVSGNWPASDVSIMTGMTAEINFQNTGLPVKVLASAVTAGFNLTGPLTFPGYLVETNAQGQILVSNDGGIDGTLTVQFTDDIIITTFEIALQSMEPFTVTGACQPGTDGCPCLNGQCFSPLVCENDECSEYVLPTTAAPASTTENTAASGTGGTDGGTTLESGSAISFPYFILGAVVLPF